MIRNLCKVAMI